MYKQNSILLLQKNNRKIGNRMDIRELQTPCFVLDEKEFENNIRDFKKILDEYFPSNRIGYSFKTNSLPYIIKKLRK